MKTLGVFILATSFLIGAEESTKTAAAVAGEKFSAKLNEGKAEEAEAIARRLLADEEAAKRLESPEVQKALDLLLEVYQHRADRSHPEMDDIGKRALALREKLQGPDSLEAAQTLRLWAIALVGRGDYSRARELMARSVEIFEKAERAGQAFSRMDIAQYSRTLGDMAGVHAEMMNWNDAKRAMLRSIALKEKLSTNSPGIGIAYMNLGRLEHYRDDHATALKWYKQARTILAAVLKPGDPMLPELLAAEGKCLYDVGYRDEGQATVERALKEREAILGPNDASLSGTIDSLAEIYQDQGKFAEALKLLEREVVLDRQAFGPLHPDVAESERHLAQVLIEIGNKRAALDHALLAERVGREHLILSVATLPEREATLFALKRMSALNIAVSLAVDASGGTKSEAIEPVYDALVRSRAIVFDELASRHGIQGSESEDAALISKLSEQLQLAREKLARLAIATGARPGTRDEDLLQAVQERDNLDRKLAAASVQYRRRIAGKSAGLKEVSASLPDDTALVSFIEFAHVSTGTTKEPSEFAAFVMMKGVPTMVVPLGLASEINAAVNEMRAKLALEATAPGIATKRNEAAYRAAGEKVRALIWDPIDRNVSGVKRIFIVADGALHTVNFAALPEAGMDGRYLVERGALFHYLSAERDMVTANALETPGSGLLAVGNPAFNRPELARGTSAGRAAGTLAVARNTAPVFRGMRSNCSSVQTMQFADLPSSGVEIDNISRIWKRSTSSGGDVIELSGELAGPSRFKEMAPGRRTIHLAVHGFAAGVDCMDPVRNENPLLLTGLAMAGANRRSESEDGILTAEEIAAMDLRGVEWAVLSACDTGLGKTSSSEGVFGLRRAFQVAGAHTVIMSLWPVEDKVTTDWMRILYEQRLNKQMDTAGAVRLASLQTLKQRRSAGLGTHPFYWAPFVAVGDWR